MIIKRLETLGLVDRKEDKADRRSMRVYLTDMGRGQAMELAKSHIKEAENILEPLSEEEGDLLADIMRKLLVDNGF